MPKETEETKKPATDKIIEKKITLAGQRNTRVVTVDASISGVIATALRQFDTAYTNFKKRLGEYNGITYEEGEEFIRQGQKIALEFSDFTEQLCSLINYKYYPPRGLDLLRKQLNQDINQEAS